MRLYEVLIHGQCIICSRWPLAHRQFGEAESSAGQELSHFSGKVTLPFDKYKLIRASKPVCRAPRPKPIVQ